MVVVAVSGLKLSHNTNIGEIVSGAAIYICISGTIEWVILVRFYFHIITKTQNFIPLTFLLQYKSNGNFAEMLK